MLDPELLEILCCPETRQDLAEATSSQLEAINQSIAGGGVLNRAGNTVTEKIGGALLRSDRQFFYVIRDEIPVLLIDEAISAAQIPGL